MMTGLESNYIASYCAHKYHSENSYLFHLHVISDHTLLMFQSSEYHKINCIYTADLPYLEVVE